MYQHNGLPVYDEALFAERWKLYQFMQHHRAYQVSNDDDMDGGVDVTTINQHSSRVLTEHEKYRKAAGTRFSSTTINLWYEGF